MFKPPHTTPSHSKTDDKLDEIIGYLDHMNRRDRLRTWGGFFRGLLGLIPLAVLLGSVWYFYEHGDDFLKKITEEAAKQAAQMTGSSADKMLREYMNR